MAKKVLKRLLTKNRGTSNKPPACWLLTTAFVPRSPAPTRATIESALINHGERIHAHVAIFTDAQFKLKASASEANPQSMVNAVKAYAQQGLAAHSAHQIEVIDGQPYQIVAVPSACAPDHWLGGHGLQGHRPVAQRPERPVRAGSGPAPACQDGRHAVSASTLPATSSASLTQNWPPHSIIPSRTLPLLVNQENSVSCHGFARQPWVFGRVALLMESVPQARLPTSLTQAQLADQRCRAIVCRPSSFITARHHHPHCACCRPRLAGWAWRLWRPYCGWLHR